ncbi:Flagellar hook-length control protein [endosymbiont of Acanthamoeba sp. UWC8]|uniref:flagellar hook-length control protein FliK n=1 Tax=endosymbiont of Acanthamoeba sp. UWC8 TaxID=86106 RepID=UPI0004D0DC3E|nr:flagellar hook-length control protein FliK [endosymbiont of Acanthamoeba sp. UWC8]AIF81612.1 Flagellar hook-length control protein [endosymbiont of Acanthamoeba sp. UWC8]
MDSLIVGSLPVNIAANEQSVITQPLLNGIIGGNIDSELGNFEQLLNGLSSFLPSEGNINLEIKPEANQQNYNFYSSLTLLNEKQDIAESNPSMPSLINHSFSQPEFNLAQDITFQSTPTFDIEKNFDFEGFIGQPREFITLVNLENAVKQLPSNDQIEEQNTELFLTPNVKKENNTDLNINSKLTNEYSEIQIIPNEMSNIPLKENLPLDKKYFIADKEEYTFFEENDSLPYSPNLIYEENSHYINTQTLPIQETSTSIIFPKEKPDVDLTNFKEKEPKLNIKKDDDQGKLNSENLEPHAEIQPLKDSRLNHQVQANLSTGSLSEFDKELTVEADSSESNYQNSISGITPKAGKYSVKPLEELKTNNLPSYSHIAEQVSMRINKAINSGETRIQVELSPQELGKIEISLQVDAMGNKKIEILSEKFTTFDILQSSVKELESSLSALTGGNEGTSLNFGLRDHQQHQQHRSQQDSNFKFEQENLDSFESQESEFLISTEHEEDNINILA